MNFSRVLTCSVLALALSDAAAQAFPTKQIILIVPFSAGGMTDAAARIVASSLEQSLRQKVIIENIAGAGGSVGVKQTSRSAPDGYRLLFGGSEVVRESQIPLDPVGLIGTSPSIVAVRFDFVGQLGSHKFPITAYSARFMDGLVLRDISRTIPIHFESYRGSGPALHDLSGGDLNLFVGDYMSVKALVDAGRVRVIAASSQPPNASSRIPSFAEAGIRTSQVESFFGLFAPKGTPQEAVKSLSDALAAALAKNDTRRGLAELGIVVKPGNAEALRGIMLPIASSIPNPCRIKTQCEREPSCNPPACPSD